MGKPKKKKITKKINPERSNKLIIAVAVGVVIVFAAAFLVFTGGEKEPVDKNELMTSTLKYLEDGEGILSLDLLPDQNKVVIVYDSYFSDRKDFRKIARYAGMKLSNKMENEELTVELLKDKEKTKVCTLVLKDGNVVREEVQ